MRTITYSYGAEFNLLEVLAPAMGGSIEGNFIKGNNELYEGTHFVMPFDNRVSALLVDATYKESALLEYRTGVDYFVGMYFHVIKEDINFIQKDESTLVGRQDYNLLIVDSLLDFDYVVDNGVNTYVVCIFIYKSALKEYMDKIPILKSLSKDVFNAKKNTIISMDRMSMDSSILINDFRKIPYDSPLFELYFKGLIYKLIGNYLEQLLTKKIIISKVMNDDVKSIIASKTKLLESVDGIFPGVDFLAKQACMSPSKYKKLFTKISGLSPGTFFYSNKLVLAKELLETGKYTVSEVSDKLNYANISYLAKRFNSKYGIFPKEYQSLL
ncbi:helix-turn-helix transcriptional regulator [Flavobacterium sp. LS1R47]|uniref:Helix-turn-helix transcriptional regulator n=1 Tax=Flavobacterium frigoritolerans TaxID=2987686 RepID=A0A9X3C0Z2_9FLAO|nr:helix-turn-helix transcriptional regulator [Flavobacterium frigoritolerans]MCV9931571.1 helix-turn-helix transcriptional regulator [Flavobacterium frigoritolerans]